jgi:rhodanese-related sulfurtransferase
MQPFAGLRAFADLWRFNALGYLAFECIAGTHSRMVLTGFYLVCAMAAAYCVADKIVPTATATVIFLALILFTAPTVNPWYWLPLLPLAVVAHRQDGVMLVSPWIGSFALMLGYANGSTLADFGITSTRGEFSVFPAVTIAEWLLMTAGFAYDLRRSLLTAALHVAVRIPMPLSNALIRRRFPGVPQIPAQHVLNAAAGAQPLLWIDIKSAYCPVDLAGRARSVASLAEAHALAAAFQQQHERGHIFISCAVGYASSEMALQLTGAGIDNVGNIEGGRRALARLQSAKAL